MRKKFELTYKYPPVANNEFRINRIDNICRGLCIKEKEKMKFCANEKFRLSL